MNKYQTVRRPLVTEKAIGSADQSNIYVFRVDLKANKVQIKEAVEDIYSVTVLSVKTAVARGKPRVYRRFYKSKEPNWKKAYVKLSESDYIDLI